MSVFGFNQVEDLIVGEAIATQTSVPDFIASANDKEIKVLSADGTDVTAGKTFKVFQKTGGNASKGLNYEFTDRIVPSNIKSIVAVKYAEEEQKIVTISGFSGTVRENSTYQVLVRILNDGGSLSPENFRVISGAYSTGTTDTFTDIVDGIVKSLKDTERLSGDTNFVITNTADTITITGAFQDNVIGRVDGRQIEFDVTATVKSNILDPISTSYPDLTVTVDQENYPGVGTGKHITNLEWFVNGYNDPYRERGYPANFTLPTYAVKGGTYNLVHINFYHEREYTSVERQFKNLTIAINETGILGINGLLAQLRVAAPDKTPADLV